MINKLFKFTSLILVLASMMQLSASEQVQQTSAEQMTANQSKTADAAEMAYSLSDATQFDRDGNHEMAVKIYRYYAMRGDDRAQFNLGVYYYEGEAVQEDWVSAYAWIKTSRTEYDPYGREQAMRGIYGGLDEQQKQQAETLAAKFLASYGSGKRQPMDLKINLNLDLLDTSAEKKGIRDKVNKHSKSKKDGRRIN